MVSVYAYRPLVAAMDYFSLITPCINIQSKGPLLSSMPFS